jgi:hypothetical protein
MQDCDDRVVDLLSEFSRGGHSSLGCMDWALRLLGTIGGGVTGAAFEPGRVQELKIGFLFSKSPSAWCVIGVPVRHVVLVLNESVLQNFRLSFSLHLAVG